MKVVVNKDRLPLWSWDYTPTPDGQSIIIDVNNPNDFASLKELWPEAEPYGEKPKRRKGLEEGEQ